MARSPTSSCLSTDEDAFLSHCSGTTGGSDTFDGYDDDHMVDGREFRLHPDEVRACAEAIEGCREIGRGGANEDVEDVVEVRSMTSMSSMASEDGSDTSRRPRRRRGEVLSFLIDRPRRDKSRRRDEESYGERDVARVNVYCHSGMVGTCRVLSGEVREVFHRRCQLRTLEQILRHPPALTVVDRSLVAIEDRHDSAERDDLGPLNGKYVTRDPIEHMRRSPVRIPYQERIIMDLREKLELADMGIAVLMGEHDTLKRQVDSLIEEQRKLRQERQDGIRSDQDTAPSSLQSPASGRGRGKREKKEFAFSLPEQTIDQVEECLRDAAKIGDDLTCVATNGPGTVFVYSSGEWAHTAGVPVKLTEELIRRKEARSDDIQAKARSRKNSRSSAKKNDAHHAYPLYVSLGTRGRYFVSFDDGSWVLKGPRELEKRLKDMGRDVQSLAFGINWDTYFVVFSDGSWECCGNSLPKDLEKKLSDLEERPDLASVSLGPMGEWFLSATNGRSWWGGVSLEIDDVIYDLGDDKTIHCLCFGEFGSYFMVYE